MLGIEDDFVADVRQARAKLAGPEISQDGRLLDQSHTGDVRLLPALPGETWPEGRVTGLRARSGFEVDIAWRDGQLAEATIRSEAGRPCRLRTSVQVTVTSGGESVETRQMETGGVVFETEPGQAYTVTADR